MANETSDLDKMNNDCLQRAKNEGLGYIFMGLVFFPKVVLHAGNRA
jgi:hypothetical protein